MSAIQVVPYDESWPNLFQEERGRLLELLSDLIDESITSAAPRLSVLPQSQKSTSTQCFANPCTFPRQSNG